MNFAKKKILVVEDECELRQIIASRLELRNAAVFQAENGILAMEHLQSQPVDLVLTDVRMPGRGADGMTLLKRVKAEIANPPPVVIMSGFADFSHSDFFNAGAAAVLEKPFSAEELEKSIAKILNSTI